MSDGIDVSHVPETVNAVLTAGFTLCPFFEIENPDEMLGAGSAPTKLLQRTRFPVLALEFTEGGHDPQTIGDSGNLIAEYGSFDYHIFVSRDETDLNLFRRIDTQILRLFLNQSHRGVHFVEAFAMSPPYDGRGLSRGHSRSIGYYYEYHKPPNTTIL